MTRRTDLLDRATDLFPAPDGALEQLRRRHHRRQRNRRLAAGGVGLAIVIAMVTIALRVGPPDPPKQPVSTPTSTATIDHGRILFVILHDGKSTLATIDAAGLHRVDSFPDPTFFHPVWASPTEIVYDGRGTGERHLYRVSLDGGEPVQLIRGTASQVRPAISPDGTLVVYDQYDPETDEDLGLHVADASDGSGARPVFPSPEPDSVGGDTSASFSPDGEWIAFSRTPEWGSGLAGIWVARTDGTDLRRLTGDELDAGYPRWSPDGDSILFSQHYNSGDLGGPLWIVPFEGGEPRPLTDHGPDEAAFEADWSPDGTQIVFKYWSPGMENNELRVVNADGTGERTIWTGRPGYTAETPDWGP